MKVAIVEDEIRIREGIEKLLKKLNRQYEVVAVAENGMHDRGDDAQDEQLRHATAESGGIPGDTFLFLRGPEGHA